MKTILKLKGKTQKGKNRVNELGEHWELFHDQKKTNGHVGDWLIKPIDTDKPLQGMLWIHSFDDPDFEIVETRILESP